MFTKKSSTLRHRAALLAAVATFGALAQVADARVMVQYFESKWETIERRMPDVFMAGYGAMWLPPAARADSSNFSAGFDLFDRFDLGSEGNETLYGTETSLTKLIGAAKAAGVVVYFDTVYNHNGFSDGYRGDTVAGACQLNWAIGEGGYPGFVMSGRDLSLPFDLEFRHICPSASFPSPSCESNALDCRIAGLIDINHETNYQYIRHPAATGNPQNIPYQQPKATNTRFYPDQVLTSPYPDGVKPFNLADNTAGDPTAENVTGMLMRYTQWMLEVNGVGGFRLDAVKHTPTYWFNDFYDFAARNRGRDFWGRQITAFSFGEFVSSNKGELLQYHRKITTPGSEANRTVLDFPLKFQMGTPCPVDWIGASVDTDDNGNGQDGSAGVMFVSSHDTGSIGDPPANDNLAYGHILTRKGYPIVYYNAREFDPNRLFPNPTSRGDAFGRFSNIITTLVRLNNNHVNQISGNNFEMRGTNGCNVAYELNNTLLVGLNGDVTITVGANGFQNVTLTEQTGNGVEPTIALGGAGSTKLLQVPSGSYVAYTIDPPKGTLSVDNISGTIAPDGVGVPSGVARLTALDIVTADTAQVRFQVDQLGTLEDNALIKWNYGLNIDGDNSGDFGVAHGVDSALVGGFDNFTSKSISELGGTGTYTVDVDLTNPEIKEGYNYITVIAFIQRLSGLPPIYNTFRKVIYVDRSAPDLQLVFPPNPTGISDITQSSYGFVVDNPDATGNSMHYFWNLPDGTDPVSSGMLNGSNKATKTDRNRYRFTLSGLVTGNNQKLTLVLFEESGRYRLQTFNVGVSAGPSAVGSWGSYGETATD